MFWSIIYKFLIVSFQDGCFSMMNLRFGYSYTMFPTINCQEWYIRSTCDLCWYFDKDHETRQVLGSWPIFRVYKAHSLSLTADVTRSTRIGYVAWFTSACVNMLEINERNPKNRVTKWSSANVLLRRCLTATVCL